MTENRMEVIYVEPGKLARTIEIEDSLEAYQGLVGGLIEEYMPFPDDVALICNDEGKMRGMDLNRGIYGEDGQLLDVIAGPFFICYAPIESETFLSMPPDLKEKYESMFQLPERFFVADNGLFGIKYDPRQREDRGHTELGGDDLL